MTRKPRPQVYEHKRWYVDLVADGQVIPFGHVGGEEEATALAEREDGGYLEWEAPDYYDGELAMGRRGVWLIDQRTPTPAEAYVAPRPYVPKVPDRPLPRLRTERGSSITSTRALV